MASESVRRTRSPRQKIDRIRQAAIAEFTEKGFSAGRVDGIARRADITKQLFYHYYASKEEVYIEILEILSGESIGEIIKHPYSQLAPVAALTLFLGTIVDQYERSPAQGVFAIDQNLHHVAHVSARSKHRTMTPKLIGILDDILKRGAHSGDFRDPIDAKLFYAMACHIVTGGFTNAHVIGMFLDFNPTCPQGIALWKRYSIDFILRSLRPDCSGTEASTAAIR
jgi:AcrR family transcriptional regulator